MEAIGKEIYCMVSQALHAVPSLGSSSSGCNSAGGQLKDLRYINNTPFYLQALKDTVKEVSTGITLRNGGEVTDFNFLGGTFLEKFINKNCTPETKAIIKGMDKSLIQSKTAQTAIKNMFDCKFQINNAGKLILTGSKEAAKSGSLKLAAGRLAADALGSTTKFGLLASGITEVPDLYAAYKNGDFGKQTVRSSTKVAISTLAFGVLAHIAKTAAPPKIRTLAMFGSAIAGSIAASKATDAVLDKVIGKSINTQKREAKKHLEQLKQQRAVV